MTEEIDEGVTIEVDEPVVEASPLVETRSFTLRGRLSMIRIPSPEEGPTLMASIELSDNNGRRGAMWLPYDPDFLNGIGTPFIFSIDMQKTSLDEYLENLPGAERPPDEPDTEPLGLV